ncbi:MAG: glycerophosphodiester phosphodiesterase [Desulfuromonadales bacterium]
MMLNSSQCSSPLIIGHRGASLDAPENTLESFCLAWDQDADGIEADFHLTSDNQIVCIHDETTGRTTGVDLRVADTTLEKLRRLETGIWKGVEWAGVLMPTLDEVLAALPNRKWLFIEIKCGAEIIPRLKFVLQASGQSSERIRLLSFSAELIAELKEQLPEWSACLLCDYRHAIRDNTYPPSREDVLETISRSGADGLASANRKPLDRYMVETLHGLGREVHVWTVDYPEEAKQLRALNVNSIMTNRPGWLRQKITPEKSIL